MTERLEALSALLPDDVDAVLIVSTVNRMYFTGLYSSAGTLLLVRGKGAYFIIDSRYIERARETVKGCEVLLQGKLYEQLHALIERHNINRIAIESDYMTVTAFARYRQQLPKVRIDMDSQVNDLILGLRARKSAEELALVRAAQRITDDAFTHILGYIKAGRTEQEVVCELLDYTHRHGSERPSFDYIVVSGQRSSMPHGEPSDKVIETGDFVTMDFGCVVGGYCSDMTRTVAVGSVSEEQRHVYDTVLAAQNAALAAACAGVPCAAVDRAARELIAAAGYGECFGHGTGHSLGLEIHETPAFSAADTTLCEPGMLITIEPGIYLEGRFGVRIENMVLITESGCESLTASGRELLLL